MGNADPDILVVEITKNGETTMEAIKSAIEGDATDIDQLPGLTKTDLVKNFYKVTDSELSIGTLEDAVVSRIACKDFVSL